MDKFDVTVFDSEGRFRIRRACGDVNQFTGYKTYVVMIKDFMTGERWMSEFKIVDEETIDSLVEWSIEKAIGQCFKQIEIDDTLNLLPAMLPFRGPSRCFV